jgi:hypothetical protein
MISQACHRNCSEFERERKKLKSLSDTERVEVLDRMYALDERFQAMPERERMEALDFYYPRKVQETNAF